MSPNDRFFDFFSGKDVLEHFPWGNWTTKSSVESEFLLSVNVSETIYLTFLGMNQRWSYLDDIWSFFDPFWFIQIEVSLNSSIWTAWWKKCSKPNLLSQESSSTLQIEECVLNSSIWTFCIIEHFLCWNYAYLLFEMDGNFTLRTFRIEKTLKCSQNLHLHFK